MRSVEVGGVRVSAIGLGTWQFGTSAWAYGSEYDARVAPAIVRRALELGVTLIDTAEAYGASERIVGQALRSTSDPRFIATKITPLLPVGPVVERAARRSCRRLGVAAIDLYQLHWPNPVVPLGWQAGGLRRVLDRGLVRNVGVSNHSLARWQALERALGRAVLSNQVEFSLARPGAARTLVPWAAGHDRLVIAYSPLAQGLLAGRGPVVPNQARRLRQMLGATPASRLGAVRALVDEIATSHRATMSQVALAWLIGHPNTVAIPGARTIEQLEDNVAAAELELTEDERRRLSAAAEAVAARPG